MGKWFRVRAPRLRIGKKGVRLIPPSVRIGDEVGVNISKRGVSGSVQTEAGSYNTRTGFTISLARLFGFGKRKK